MYSGYLESFYQNNTGLQKLSFKEHIEFLLQNSTEFAGSYIINFRKLGIEADCVIVNDTDLQRKWAKEKGIRPDNNSDILFDQVKHNKPDILWIEDMSFIDPDWIGAVRHEVKSIRLVVAYHCAPFNSKILENLKAIDFFVTCTPGIKSLFESMGKKSFLVYHGFDPRILSRINNVSESFNHDFIFSGSLISGGDFHNSRIRLIESILKNRINIGLYVNLEKKYRIRIKQSIYILNNLLKKINLENLIEKSRVLKYGKSRVNTYSQNLLKQKELPLYGMDMYNLFCHSKIVLNYHIGIAGDFAGNMRMFEVTGVGSCLLTDNKKNMPELFDTTSEVVVYDNEDDCIAKVKWLLEHEAERKNIALAGQKKTLNYHTVEKRCEILISILKKQLDVTMS
jgi:spore maturation protein CgeB